MAGGWLDRVLTAIRARLGHRRAPLWAMGIALVLALPSLGNGLVLDDHLHRLRIREEGLGAVRNLFEFWSGRRQDMQALVDHGGLPWFAHPEMQIRFWRPVSALTHVLDYSAWPAHPFVMHVHSLAWFLLFLGATALLYRRLFVAAAPWVAALATVLVALDDAHGIPVGWLANRNGLVAGVFGVLSVVLHDRWRRDGWRPAAVLAPLAAGVALLSGEGAVGAFAYLASYALILDRGRLMSRLGSLAPYAGVLALWRAAYASLGFGVHGSGIYVDPGRDPARFLANLPARATKLLLGALAEPPSDAWILVKEDAPAMVLGVVVLGAMLWVTLPVVRADRVARFWALGAVLAVIPAAACAPLDRLLLFVGIGAMGLVACVLRAVAEGTNEGRGRGVRALAAFWLVAHAVVAPVGFVFASSAPGILNRLIVLAREGLREPDNLAARTLVILNANNILGPVVVNARESSSAVVLFRPVMTATTPARTRTLVVGDRPVTVTRTEDRVLRVHLEGGMMDEASSRLLRSEDQPLILGQATALSGLTITVTSMLRPGAPDEIECRFDRSLEDAGFWWVSWNGKRFETVDVPRLGESASYNTLQGR